MYDPTELALVYKALHDGLGGGVEWDERSARNVISDVTMQGLLPKFLRRELIDYVRAQGIGVVKQVVEDREEYRDQFDYYYKVILPMRGFKHGIFVEMVLTGEDDPEFPEVTLVGAHPQRK